MDPNINISSLSPWQNPYRKIIPLWTKVSFFYNLPESYWELDTDLLKQLRHVSSHDVGKKNRNHNCVQFICITLEFRGKKIWSRRQTQVKSFHCTNKANSQVRFLSVVIIFSILYSASWYYFRPNQKLDIVLKVLSSYFCLVEWGHKNQIQILSWTLL